ncbi:MAG: lipoyl(octanoyl) transferase LipB, partial [Rhodospirillales bacterium]|nr:lipoyl(octanoyl) transferase LipB [Rhodospirillales bacterium]
GTSAAPGELLTPNRFPVFHSGRGGRFTYHGPGQRVAYVMLDVKRRGGDVRCFVHRLEEWIIAALACIGVPGERRAGRIGIWVATPEGDAKIAAIGVRIRRWISFHGIAVNVDPNLDHFSGIVPCGLSGYPVTSLAALGIKAGMSELDEAFHHTFEVVFGDVAPEGNCGLTGK